MPHIHDSRVTKSQEESQNGINRRKQEESQEESHKEAGQGQEDAGGVAEGGRTGTEGGRGLRGRQGHVAEQEHSHKESTYSFTLQ